MYRIGGDEFVVLYHGNDVDGVCRELEKGFLKTVRIFAASA